MILEELQNTVLQKGSRNYYRTVHWSSLDIFATLQYNGVSLLNLIKIFVLVRFLA